MKTLQTGTADRQALASKVAELDVHINKLTKWFNATSFKTGSVMLSGKSSLSKEFHELMIFSKDLPIPVARIKQFLGDYCSDLIAEKHNLLRLIELTEQPKARAAHCPHCVKVTIQEYIDESIKKIPGIPFWTYYTCFECKELIAVSDENHA